MAPVVLRAGPYRCYFYSQEPDEPPHVHVDRDDGTAKLWLEPVRVAYAIGFRPHELRTVERLVREHQTTALLEAWHGRFPPPTRVSASWTRAAPTTCSSWTSRTGGRS